VAEVSPAQGSICSGREQSAVSKEILDGKHDDVPEQNFYMKGGIDMTRE